MASNFPLAFAARRFDQVAGAVGDAASQSEAEERLAAQFGWDAHIAANVLRLRVYYMTAPGLQEMDQEIADLRHQLGLPGGAPAPPIDSLRLPTD